ncbi:MAG: lipopolysaccharide heptosyltransferase II [candidate division KSB1 bacterium]|nr:lipopolysaccharide heptosyltransferase II [candidate division KSB1 bacterium]
MTTYKRILIVQTAFLGDLVLTTPLIRAVRQLFPNSRIDALVIPQTRDIVRHNPHLSNIYTFDKRENKKQAFTETVSKLKKVKYDLAISPHRSLTSMRILLKSAIPRRIGFRAGLPSLLLTDRVRYRQDISEIKRNLSLLTPLHQHWFDIQTEILIDPQSRTAAKDRLAAVPDQHYRIAVAPGSVWPTKRWPEEHFVSLLSGLAGEPVTFVMIGSANEKDLCQRVIDTSNCKNAINTAGSTSLLQAAALIQLCNLFVGNDSGSLHIANAVQTDVIAFFGPTHRSLGFYPFRSKDKVFETDLVCRPCSRHGSQRCPLGHFKCMKTLYPEPVGTEIIKRIRPAQTQRI